MKPNYFTAVIKAVNPDKSYQVFVFDKECRVVRKDIFIPKIPIFNLNEYIQFFKAEEREFVLCQII